MGQEAFDKVLKDFKKVVDYLQDIDDKYPTPDDAGQKYKFHSSAWQNIAELARALEELGKSYNLNYSYLDKLWDKPYYWEQVKCYTP